MHKIIWFIGRYVPKFRLWYYKKTGKWYWGIIPFINLNDLVSQFKEYPNDYPHEYISDSAWLNDQLYKMFKVKKD